MRNQAVVVLCRTFIFAGMRSIAKRKSESGVQLIKRYEHGGDHSENENPDAPVSISDVIEFLGDYGLGSLDEAKNRVLKNINPYGYSRRVDRQGERIFKKEVLPSGEEVTKAVEISPLQRLAEAVFQDEREYLKKRNVNDAFFTEEMELYNPKSKEYQERSDLLAMLLGKDQPYGEIEEAKYRPSIAKDDSSKYYRSKATERDILGYIEDNISLAVDERGNRKMIDGPSRAKGAKGVLGNYTLDVGFDEKVGLPYISYYDVWDLNPLGKATGSSVVRSIEDKVQGALGFTSPELYGRVYFDPSKYQYTGESTYGPDNSNLTLEQMKLLDDQKRDIEIDYR